VTPAEPLVSLVAPGSLEADQYRTARQAVERLRRESGFQVFAVTSPGAGDGKTITTLNIAGALAQAPQARVLVIDADLHRPAVSNYLGLECPRAPGLAEVISDPDCGLARATRRLDGFNLSVLPAGDAQVRPYELLASGRVEGLLAEARRAYDFVVIDTPPVVALGDARLLGRWVDGFIVVVAAHRTPRKLLAEALTLLEPARIIGVVFNGDDRPLTAYYGYHGYYSSGSTSPRS
jgi:receptor protein-tyrosine kinase